MATTQQYRSGARISDGAVNSVLDVVFDVLLKDYKYDPSGTSRVLQRLWRRDRRLHQEKRRKDARLEAMKEG